MSVLHVIGTSFYGGQWRGGFVPAGFFVPVCQPCHLSALNRLTAV